jgi:hypothetical protein
LRRLRDRQGSRGYHHHRIAANSQDSIAQWRSAIEAYLRGEFADLARIALNEIRHEDE